MAITISGTTGIVADNISDATIQLLQPTGSLLMWPTDTAPTGFLLCNGQAVSRDDYADLFAVIQTTFGAGDESTTFNLPDYRDRMPIGAGTTYSVNSTGGSADAIVVEHNHTATSSVTDPGHRHSLHQAGSGYNPGGYSNASPATDDNTGFATTGITVATTVDSTGSSGTNANLPPYLGIYFIIKT